MQFDLPKEQSSIIKVIGVGGGGSNAVTHMYNLGIKDVNFVICNTDAQALQSSPVPNKVQLGASLTEGLGAGSLPDVGREAALESVDEIQELLGKNTKMVFITAGMGGGTGTGGAPVIAQAAKEMGILTVAIVTTPFDFEGNQRMQQAKNGIEELKDNVDSLLIISNNKLREIYGNFFMKEAFAQADNVLTTAAKGIAEIITYAGVINVDFADVRTVMKDSGVAILGSDVAKGEDRAAKAIEKALASPLLNDNDIRGARHILLNISSGEGDHQATMDEINTITDFLQHAAGRETNVIPGICYDSTLEDNISVTVIATGFEPKEERRENQKIVHKLDEDLHDEAYQPKKEQPADENEINSGGQRTIEFDINEERQKKTVQRNPYATPSIKTKKEQAETQRPESEERSADKDIERSTRERINRLRELSVKLKNPHVLKNMEEQPAYERKKVDLEDIPHSSDDSEVSRYTLDMNDDDDKPQIRKNNSFLHDNVD